MNWVSVQPLNGGMSIGFEQALGKPPTFVVSAGFPHEDHYEKFLNETCGHDVPFIMMDGTYKDFEDETNEQLFKSLNEDIDIVNYVPVCAGLSMLNTVSDECSTCRRGDPHNSQNQNMYQTTRFILESIKPKVAVFENAPGAYTKLGEGVINILKQIATDNGYSMTLEKTNTFLHGIPQHRQRTFIYFWKESTASYLEYEKKEPVLLSEYLEQIPSSAAHHDIYVQSKESIRDFTYEYLMEEHLQENESSIREVLVRLDPDRPTVTGSRVIQTKIGFEPLIQWINKKIEAYPEEEYPIEHNRYTKALRLTLHRQYKVSIGKGYWDNSVAMHHNGTSTNAIISKNLNRLVHPTEDRAFTIRELLHMMGLPHDYDLINPEKTWPHLAQSVPVATSRYVGNQCKRYVLGLLLKDLNASFIKQNNISQEIDFPKESIYVGKTQMSMF
jgi:site-specific DNA-cytosine methylase